MKKCRYYMYLMWKVLVYLIIFAFMVLIGFYVYAYITPKMDINKSNRIVMLDSEDEVFYQSTHTNSWVSLSEISEYA